MSQITSFRPFHVYTLRRPLAPNSPIRFALIITHEDFLYRHYQDIVSVLLLSPTPRATESDIRVKICCKGNGGTAHLPADHYVAVDSIFPLEKGNLILASGSEIHEREKEEIKAKVAVWLGLDH